VLLASALLVATITIKLLLDGRSHLRRAHERLEVDDLVSAVAELEDAVKSYVPGSRYSLEALREMEILAKGSEMRGNVEEAATIWETVRRGILATRHFIQPYSAQLVVAERALSRLRSATVVDGSLGPAKRPDDPSPFASLCLFLGLGSWISGALFLCYVPAQKKKGEMNSRTYAWILCLSGLCLWILMAWIAG
jgi:hypothetical protein